MAKTASPTSASTVVAAGVKTPGSGAFSDPTQVGSMIQKMYPGYYDNVDPTTLGQRWIAVHTPAPSAAGAGTGTLDLQGPTGTTPMTTTDPNSPDLSGLSKFQTPVKQQVQPKPQAPVKIAPTAGMNQLTQGNQLAQQPQNNTPWLGSEIASGVQNFFKAPNLQVQSTPPGY